MQTTTWNESLFQLKATRRGHLVSSVGSGTLHLWRPSTGKLLSHIRGRWDTSQDNPLSYYGVGHGETGQPTSSGTTHEVTWVQLKSSLDTILSLLLPLSPSLPAGQSSSTHCLEIMGEQLVSASSNGHVVIHNYFEHTVSQFT